MMNALKSYFLDTDSWLVLMFLILVSITTIVFNNELLLTDELYFNSLGEQLTYSRIRELIQFREKWQWLQYAFIPLFLLLKVCLVTICLNTGLLLSPHSFRFTDIFKITLRAELVFVLGTLINTLIFYLFIDYSNLEDLNQMNFLSLLSFFNPENVAPWLVYPLSSVNVYEILFVGLLALGITLSLNIQFKQSLNIVAGSYGSAFILWMLAVVFIQITVI